jgi:hypothetical protein
MKPEELKQEINTLKARVIDLEKLLKSYETDFYKVNWDKAPHWAEYHAYDESGEGYWFGCFIPEGFDFFDGTQISGYQISDSLMDQHQKTWRNSKTANPYIF